MPRLFNFTRVFAALTVLVAITPVALLGAQEPEVAMEASTTAWWIWPLSFSC